MNINKITDIMVKENNQPNFLPIYLTEKEMFRYHLTSRDLTDLARLDLRETEGRYPLARRGTFVHLRTYWVEEFAKLRLPPIQLSASAEPRCVSIQVTIEGLKGLSRNQEAAAINAFLKESNFIQEVEASTRMQFLGWKRDPFTGCHKFILSTRAGFGLRALRQIRRNLMSYVGVFYQPEVVVCIKIRSTHYGLKFKIIPNSYSIESRRFPKNIKTVS